MSVYIVTNGLAFIFFIIGFHFGFNWLMRSKRVFTHPLISIPLRYNLLSKLNYLNLSVRRYNPIGKFIKKRINILLWQNLKWKLPHISAIDVGINGFQGRKKNQPYVPNVKVHIGTNLGRIIRKRENENNT